LRQTQSVRGGFLRQVPSPDCLLQYSHQLSPSLLAGGIDQLLARMVLLSLYALVGEVEVGVRPNRYPGDGGRNDGEFY